MKKPTISYTDSTNCEFTSKKDFETFIKENYYGSLKKVQKAINSIIKSNKDENVINFNIDYNLRCFHVVEITLDTEDNSSSPPTFCLLISDDNKEVTVTYRYYNQYLSVKNIKHIYENYLTEI